MTTTTTRRSYFTENGNHTSKETKENTVSKKGTFFIQGTPKQLVENGLTVNGKPVTQQMISVLVKLGACEDMGPEERAQGAKGPAARVYRFYGRKAFSFALDKQKAEQLQKEQSERESKQDNAKNAEVMRAALPAPLQNLGEKELETMIQALQAMQALVQSTPANGVQ